MRGRSRRNRLSPSALAFCAGEDIFSGAVLDDVPGLARTPARGARAVVQDDRVVGAGPQPREKREVGRRRPEETRFHFAPPFARASCARGGSAGPSTGDVAAVGFVLVAAFRTARATRTKSRMIRRGARRGVGTPISRASSPGEGARKRRVGSARFAASSAASLGKSALVKP